MAEEPLDEIADVLEAFLADLEAGRAPMVESYLARYPHLAAELESALRALVTMETPQATPSHARLADDLTQLGEFDIVRLLGRGGMGSVYLARHGEDLVAVKVLHAHLLERAGLFRRFLLEAELGRRVHHTNVVRTLSVDACRVGSETVHYLVMEYVEGATLREMLRETGPLPEALIREIGSQVAAGLAAIHAGGIVHRDLKPENVLITHDHRVRVMDLGVARVTEASVALTREGEFAGSLPYAAPEQFGQGEIGPVADLYALGVLLYELATGRNPFRRDAAAATMKAHLEYVPPSLRQANPELSPFLALVVETLLRKRSQDRFPSASTLEAVLRGGEESSWWTTRETEVARARAELPAIPVRRDTKLHGRDPELAWLMRTWEDARAGEGRVVLLEGEAGIGKTRLVDAFVNEFESDDVCVLYGSYPPGGGTGGLSSAITAHLGSSGLEQALRPYLGSLPELVPAVAAAVRHQRPPPDVAPLGGDALHTALVALMRGLAADRPLVWVVDDLHFADSQSRRLILSLARGVAGHPVLLLLTSRPGLPEEEIVHYGWLDTFHRRALPRLGAREVIELLRDAFHSRALAEKLGGKIAYKSDGVPFFVFEMIRGLRDGLFITELPDGSYVETFLVEEIEVPSAIRDLVTARLRDLDDEERNLLDVAAVQGHEFDPDLLARVWSLTPLVVLTTLAAIERRSGLIRASGRRYRFDHHQVQEILYADLFEPLREQYHAALADAFAAREGVADRDPEEVSGETAAFLAWHHLRGQRPGEARAYLSPAVDHLAGTHRPDDALQVVDAALDVEDLVSGAARIRALVRRSRLLAVLGRSEPACLASQEALAAVADIEDVALRADVFTCRGRCLYEMSRFDEAREVLEEAVHMARGGDTPLSEIEARQLLGTVLADQGRLPEAEAQQEQALGLAREHDDAVGEVGALVNLGVVQTYAGRYAESEATLARAMDLSQSVGSLEHEMTAAGNLGGACMAQKRFAEARSLAERQLALAEQVGNRRIQAHAAGNLSIVASCTGRPAEALEYAERLLVLAKEVGDRVAEEVGLSLLGTLEHQLGYHDRAERHCREAIVLTEAIGVPGRSGLARNGLARCRHDRGDVAEAIRIEEEALAIHRETQAKGQIAEVLLYLGQLYREAGDAPRARACLDEALALADELGPHCPDAEIQCQFAVWPGGDATAAAALLAERAESLEADCRMRCRLLLWQATGDAAVLEAAWRELEALQRHAPPDAREAMVTGVSLHRAIADAWHGRGLEETHVSD